MYMYYIYIYIYITCILQYFVLSAHVLPHFATCRHSISYYVMLYCHHSIIVVCCNILCDSMLYYIISDII